MHFHVAWTIQVFALDWHPTTEIGTNIEFCLLRLVLPKIQGFSRMNLSSAGLNKVRVTNFSVLVVVKMFKNVLVLLFSQFKAPALQLYNQLILCYFTHTQTVDSTESLSYCFPLLANFLLYPFYNIALFSEALGRNFDVLSLSSLLHQ